VDAVEIWHFYDGDPLELSTPSQTVTLGREHPQAVIPAGVWQAARPLGRWTLVGCTVAPPFGFDRFELAPPGWEPGPPR
jgi:predicted cupin superfamily sugar epimerase